jgi:MYXO-CTERM domain-containing protein
MLGYGRRVRKRVVCVALLCVAAVAEPAIAADDVALLRAHRPELRHDRSERYFATSVEAWRAGRAGEPVIYGRAVRRRDGGRWLQYWIFYAFNPQDRGVVRTGRHEGDWELVQLRLDPQGRPEHATLRAHTWAQGCRWSELVRTHSGAPVVFVANGSHANYSRPGVHDRPWPDPNDEADGRGRAVRPPVEPSGVAELGGRGPDRSIEPTRQLSPRWLAWPGRFGSSEASFVPGEQSSPRGPAFQPEWADPARLEREARSCTAEPPGRAWQAPVMIGLVALPVLILAARARRRRRPAEASQRTGRG